MVEMLNKTLYFCSRPSCQWQTSPASRPIDRRPSSIGSTLLQTSSTRNGQVSERNGSNLRRDHNALGKNDKDPTTSTQLGSISCQDQPPFPVQHLCLSRRLGIIYVFVLKKDQFVHLFILRFWHPNRHFYGMWQADEMSHTKPFL